MLQPPDHSIEHPPDVTSWSIPSTEMVALAIGLPWRSRTNPLTPRCICERQGQPKSSHEKWPENMLHGPHTIDLII
jgi:hypothetical protein